MSDFTTLKSLTIPEGVVTQITDEIGAVIWVKGNDPAILEVEKIISDTYAGETTYPNEEFILLDIYPKNANSKVTVTYCGVSKPLEFTGTNAKTVYFGTFNGVPDKEETPASGTLTIEGGFRGFGAGSYQIYSSLVKKAVDKNCVCITAIHEWESVTVVPDNAFSDGVSEFSDLVITELPKGLKSIGKEAFYNCKKVSVSELPNGLVSVGDSAFYNCIADGNTSYDVSIPDSVSSIGVNPWVRNGSYCNNFITVDKNNPNYKIDGNCLIEVNTNAVIAGYADYEIPSYIEIIGESAFRGNYGIQNINIPEGVKIIRAYAFFNGYSARTINIPSSVKNIGSQAFDKSNKKTLEKVIVNATTPPTAESGFIGYSTDTFHAEFKIVVPKGCGEAYKAAEVWSKFADYIVEAS